MLDFPNSPSPGQTFNSITGGIYVWDGTSWNIASSATLTASAHNLIVNPAMAVSQENGTTAGSAVNYYPADQWLMSGTAAICSGQQVVSVTPGGSPNRVRKTVTAQKVSLAAGDWSGWSQAIEANRIAPLMWGTVNALQALLRFGFKAPAGTYSFALRNGGTNRVYVKNFVIAAGQANTDTLQTFVVPGDTTGTWPTDNTVGLYISIADAVGTTYQGVEGWQAGNLLGTAANTNQVATNGNVVELFDVGLYADPDKTGLPPKFEVPDYDDDLHDCMRYWEKQSVYIVGYHVAGNQLVALVFHKVVMRTTPTVTYSVTSYGNSSGIATQGANDAAVLGVGITLTGTGGCSMQGAAISSARM